jgi:hypothetical protein
MRRDWMESFNLWKNINENNQMGIGFFTDLPQAENIIRQHSMALVLPAASTLRDSNSAEKRLSKHY